MSLTDDAQKQPLIRAPWPTLLLIAMLVITHIARILAPAKLSQEILINYAFIPARYSAEFLAAHGLNPGTWWEQVLPFFTYNFLHADFGHLAVNSVWLLAFGAIVARRLGATVFFIFFLICGVAGAAAHMVFNWASAAPVIGASAAISGLMGAAFRIIGSLRQPDGEAHLAPLTSRRILLWSLIWVGVNIFAGVTGLGDGTTVRLIAWQAHIGGYVAGLLLIGPAIRLSDRRLNYPLQSID